MDRRRRQARHCDVSRGLAFGGSFERKQPPWCSTAVRLRCSAAKHAMPDIGSLGLADASAMRCSITGLNTRALPSQMSQKPIQAFVHADIIASGCSA